MCSSIKISLSSIVKSLRDWYVPASSPVNLLKASLIFSSKARRCFKKLIISMLYDY